MSTKEIYSFKVESRDAGKHNSRGSRNIKKVPAIVYGPKCQNTNVLADEVAIVKHRSPRFESTLFKLECADSKINQMHVLLKKIQYHPVTNRPVHVDFYALDMDKKVRVNVTLEFVGTAAGVKESGGIFQTIMHEVEIECDPRSIPQTIKVDVSGVGLNESLHVSDISFPENVKSITAPSRTVATVTAYVEEKAAPVVAAATDAAAPAAGAAPAAAAGAAPAAAAKAAPAKDAKK
jgi:large subunit ribosomal protein L25